MAHLVLSPDIHVLASYRLPHGLVHLPGRPPRPRPASHHISILASRAVDRLPATPSIAPATRTPIHPLSPDPSPVRLAIPFFKNQAAPAFLLFLPPRTSPD